jgi:protein-disulfide isomerase
MKDKWLVVGVSALVIALGFWGAKFLYKTEAAKKITAQESSSFVRDHSARMGSENPKVTVVEFLDPECESCRSVYPGVKEIVKEFEGEVELVVRYAPFHPNSVFAIKILEAARKQKKYWETLALLFETQPEWGSHHQPQPEKIWDFLPQIGLDVDKIRSEMNDPKTFDLIELDKEDGRKLGVTGTPTFFVNEKPLEELSMENLRDAIRRELKARK